MALVTILFGRLSVNRPCIISASVIPSYAGSPPVNIIGIFTSLVSLMVQKSSDALLARLISMSGITREFKSLSILKPRTTALASVRYSRSLILSAAVN